MRVLEISDKEEAAAYCGKLLRRWGAEVVKAESPGRPEPEPHLDTYLNGGKRRVTLDLTRPEDHAALGALAASADIVVTDYSARDTTRLGLLDLGSPGARPVMVSITPFGLSGPYRDYPATASTLLALGGYTWLMGDRGREPLTMPGRYVFYQAGTIAYVSALVAHMDASRSAPTRVEVCILECLASLHQFTDTMWLSGGIVRSRHGNRWENLAPTTLLQCQDGWYGINILANFWFSFAHMIGRPDMASEGVFSTNSGRMANQDELEDIIGRALWHLPRKTVFQVGQETWRVPVGYAASLVDLLDDPHLQRRGFWQPIGGRTAMQPEEGQLRTAGSPFRFAGEEPPDEFAPRLRGSCAPGFGEQPAVGEPSEPRAAPTRGDTSRPLAGVRVLDLTRIWSGPLATRILGDLGAEVIKVESHDGRGGARGFPGAPARHWNRQALFNKLNRNKKSVAVDLKSEKGRDIFLRLVAVSDVVIENFSARAMPGLGLSYDAMKAVNSKIVYLPMPAFGLFGPYRDYVGLGPSIEPVTGMTAIMGYSDDEPMVTSKAITDAVSGTAAAAAVVTALERRSRTGLGCLIDLSQHETGIAFLGEYFIETQMSGREPERLGNAHATYAPHGVYRCRGDDQWIAIAARSESEWLALCDVLALGHLPGEARFSSASERRAHSAALDLEIAARVAFWAKEELQDVLLSRGVPAGAVLSAPEWLGDPHLAARRFFVELVHPEAGPTYWDGFPVTFDGARAYRDWAAAPCLGEHNRGLLAELLGLSVADLDSLYAEGVLAESPPDAQEV